jgi:diguanylate cyclase (GGDEF)-like protein/PAS domain S-box-containing protein
MSSRIQERPEARLFENSSMTAIASLESGGLLESVLQQAFNSVVITDARFDNGGPLIVKCNPAFSLMTGYTTEELIGQSPRILQGPQTDPRVIDELRACLREGRYFQGSTVNYRKDGQAYIVEWNISPIRDEHGHICNFVSMQRNITDRVKAESERDLLARALNVARDPVLITNSKGQVEFANRAFEQVSGYAAEEILGQTPKFLKSGQHDTEFYELLRSALARGEPFRATFANRRKDGEVFYVDQSIAPITDDDGTVQHFVSVSKDITRKVLERNQLLEQASRDALTGMLNRRSGELALQAAHNNAKNDDVPFSVLMADIDHFKKINDQHGHGIGDEVLKQIALTIQEQTRDDDQAVRWGGEEFVVILNNAPASVAHAAAERIRNAVATAAYPKVERVTLSLGYGEWQRFEPLDHLLERVDAALYSAKKAGRNRVCTASGQQY